MRASAGATAALFCFGERSAKRRMTHQLSKERWLEMWGLAVIIALYFYTRLAIWVARKLAGKRESKQWKWGVRAAVTLVFVLIPTWDSILGHIYFNHLCATEAGVKVYQTVELPAEYWDAQGKPKFFNEQGYLDHQFWVNTLDETSGNVERYSSIFAIDKDAFLVKEKSSKKRLEEIITFGFGGGGVSRNFSPHNTAASCEFIRASDFSPNFYGQLFKSATSTR